MNTTELAEFIKKAMRENETVSVGTWNFPYVEGESLNRVTIDGKFDLLRLAQLIQAAENERRENES